MRLKQSREIILQMFPFTSFREKTYRLITCKDCDWEARSSSTVARGRKQLFSLIVLAKVLTFCMLTRTTQIHEYSSRASTEKLVLVEMHLCNLFPFFSHTFFFARKSCSSHTMSSAAKEFFRLSVDNTSLGNLNVNSHNCELWGKGSYLFCRCQVPGIIELWLVAKPSLQDG